MLTMREMASVMMMMALGTAPTQTIKIGPRATLGRAFKMTRYGSRYPGEKFRPPEQAGDQCSGDRPQQEADDRL